MASQGTGTAELAARYAAALFELADEQKALDETARDLAALKAMLRESADLSRMVRNPLLTRVEQGKALDAVLEKAGVSALVRRFVGLVAANRRLFALAAMADAFLADLSRRRGQMTARIEVARPLTDAQQAALTEQLRRAIGNNVAMSVTVDPSLIGGLVVKVGSRMIDGSVRTKLSKLQRAMKGVG